MLPGSSKNKPGKEDNEKARNPVMTNMTFTIDNRENCNQIKIKESRYRSRAKKVHCDDTLDRLTALRLSCRETRLVVFGHSYAKPLKSTGIRVFCQDGRMITVRYVYKSGKDYDYFLNDESLLHDVGSFDPHYVFVTLAGNAVGSPKPIEEIETSCSIFYAILREFCPKAFIIATQVENRFYKPNNRFGAPWGKEYQKKRERMNRYIFKKLRNKDYILQMGALNHQEERKWFENDGVHFTKHGYRCYFRRIRRVLNYIHEKIDDKLQEEEAFDRLYRRVKDRVQEQHQSEQ